MYKHLREEELTGRHIVFTCKGCCDCKKEETTYSCHKCKKEHEVYFDEMFAPYDAFMTPSELVEVGIYTSNDAAYQVRCKGIGPPYVRIGRMIKYPTLGVSAYLTGRLVEEEKKIDEHS